MWNFWQDFLFIIIYTLVIFSIDHYLFKYLNGSKLKLVAKECGQTITRVRNGFKEVYKFSLPHGHSKGCTPKRECFAHGDYLGFNCPYPTGECIDDYFSQFETKFTDAKKHRKDYTSC